jgi:hypothetical protein
MGINRRIFKSCIKGAKCWSEKVKYNLGIAIEKSDGYGKSIYNAQANGRDACGAADEDAA